MGAGKGIRTYHLRGGFSNGVNDTVQCHPYPYKIQARQDTKANTISPASYNTVVGSRRHAHATELYRLHLFNCQRVITLLRFCRANDPQCGHVPRPSRRGSREIRHGPADHSQKLLPTSFSFPCVCVTLPIIVYCRRLSTPNSTLSGKYIKIVFGTPLVQANSRIPVNRGVLYWLGLWLAKARGCAARDT